MVAMATHVGICLIQGGDCFLYRIPKFYTFTPTHCVLQFLSTEFSRDASPAC